MSIPINLENEIDDFVNQTMQVWDIPGLALAIVKDDQIRLAKGYGIRDIDKSDRVDEHTLFAIGSNTKAFTATAVALLVQDGKLAWWDDPVLGESLILFITNGQGQVTEFRVKIREDWIDPLEHLFKKMN